MTGGMVVQYQETDWGFFKRLASRLNTVIVPDCTNNHTCFFFGIPIRKEQVELADDSYTESYTGRNREYIVESREIFKLCSQVLFNGMNLLIYKIESYILRNELIHRYYLRPRSAFKTERYENKKIIGASIMGTVTKIKNECIQVDICSEDDKPDGVGNWFSYATVYSSPAGTGWYCMPEPGDRVRVCFPDSEEEHAYVCSACHCTEENSFRDDPNNKFLRTNHNKEVRFTPDKILLTNHKGLSVELNDEKGVVIKSNKSISIVASEDINLKSQNQVKIQAEDGIMLIQNRNSLLMRNGIRQNGLSVRYK